MLGCGILFAQQTRSVIYLKNGSVVKGNIIEQVPNQSVKVKTKDGSIFVYKTEEISTISQEVSKANSGVEFNANFGLLTNALNNNQKSMLLDIGIGKRCTENFYMGFNVGDNFSTENNNHTSWWNFALTFRFFVPFEKSNKEFFFDLKPTLEYHYLSVDDIFKRSIEFIPGLLIHMTKSTDMVLGLGYKFGMQDNDIWESAVSAKVGLNFKL